MSTYNRSNSGWFGVGCPRGMCGAKPSVIAALVLLLLLGIFFAGVCDTLGAEHGLTTEELAIPAPPNAGPESESSGTITPDLLYDDGVAGPPPPPPTWERERPRESPADVYTPPRDWDWHFNSSKQRTWGA